MIPLVISFFLICIRLNKEKVYVNESDIELGKLQKTLSSILTKFDKKGKKKVKNNGTIRWGHSRGERKPRKIHTEENKP